MHKKRFPLHKAFNPAISGSKFFEDLFNDEIQSTDAMFLGPKGENADLLFQLLNSTLKSIVAGRKEFHPEDESSISNDFKLDQSYKKSVEIINKNFSKLLDLLDEYDTPFYSFRYQGHMNWELTIPSIASYFAAMLHNSNNVTVQASTGTTYLELALGRDICRMIGMTKNSPSPWAHITCDGTIANIEALWSARELKFFPFAVRSALLNESLFSSAKDIEIKQPNENIKKLLDFSNWELFNITNDEILSIPKKMSSLCKIDESVVWDEILQNYSLNSLGISEFNAKHKLIFSPSLAVPSTKHYSWTKAASVLGLGHGRASDNFNKGLLNIYVDEKARMDISELEKMLEYCSNPKNNKPLMLVVAVMGSTEESAVDPLKNILELREKYRKEKNFDFNIHADAAYGGYCITALRKNYPIEWPFDDKKEEDDNVFLEDNSKVPLSSYVIEQMKLIHRCDSVTIDPHKWAYVPYPAGSLTYRNGEMINLVSFGAPYIGDESTLPSVGGFGLEGSKPGASAASVFFSQVIIRPSIDGYGRIISNCLINARLFYLSLINMETENSPFFVVPLPELDNLSKNTKQTLEYIKKNLHAKKHEHIFSDIELYSVFKEIGPDQNMVDYIFNFYTDVNHKIPNTDIDKINELNKRIYDKLHIKEGKPTPQIDLILSMTTFKREDYGDKFINHLSKRLKADRPQNVQQINCLRSTVMDPWLAETKEHHQNFFEKIFIPVLNETVTSCIE